MTRGPFRSLLFAPGNQSRKVKKVFGAGADGAILDLEDAVALSEKEGARPAVVEALKAPRKCLGLVRVNAQDTEFSEGDLGAVVGGWAAYSTMATGIRSMALLALAFYVASLVALVIAQKRGKIAGLAEA